VISEIIEKNSLGDPWLLIK